MSNRRGVVGGGGDAGGDGWWVVVGSIRTHPNYYWNRIMYLSQQKKDCKTSWA